MSHPRTIFASSGVPSPFSFLMLVASSRGIGSSACVGRNMVCIARSAAFCPLLTQSDISNITVMISSIYPSAAAGWNGTETMRGSASANGVVGEWWDVAVSHCV